LRYYFLLVILALLPFFFSPQGNSQAQKIRFTDITAQAGITFKHVASPDKKYIVESMSGGVALFDYDNDGDLDIYFVNALTVDLVKSKGKTKSELYRNDGNGKFTEVSEKAGVSDIGWGMGAAVGDYNNDGFEDLYVTCLGPDHLLKNNGNGTFSDVTAKAGVNDPRWTTGASFVDYDKDGDLDLFVSNYVDFDINNLPEFGQGKTCQYKSIPVQCGPRGLKGAGDSLFRNNGDGTFTDVSKDAGVIDANGYYGLGVLTGDYDDDGWVDIFVANDSTPNFHYRNKGNGTFEEIGFTAGTAVTITTASSTSSLPTSPTNTTRFIITTEKTRSPIFHMLPKWPRRVCPMWVGARSFSTTTTTAGLTCLSPTVTFIRSFPVIASRACCTGTIATRRSLKCQQSLARS
jgi:hypothetical protein